ncbi:MAG: DUF6869 domain-containing protein [Methylibium sp.]
MTWGDERLGFGSTPAPFDEDVQARLKALSPEELVRAWRVASTTSLRDRTDGTYAVSMYFDRLGHDEPERAVSFIDALLAQEPDNALVALTAQEKLLGQLLHFNGPLGDLSGARPGQGARAGQGPLEIEANPNVLGLLAAGMLEDLIPSQDGAVVDAAVAEAARNPRFRHLLGGVWFYSVSPEVTEKLEKARGGERW